MDFKKSPFTPYNLRIVHFFFDCLTWFRVRIIKQKNIHADGSKTRYGAEPQRGFRGAEPGFYLESGLMQS